MLHAQIAGLYLYPIKSCAGISLTEARLTPFGLRTSNGLIGDRQWMIVDDKGMMQTQRKLPIMATLQTHCDDQGRLYLTRENFGKICISMPNTTKASYLESCASDTATQTFRTEQASTEVKIWADKVEAETATTEINTWITHALESKNALRLVRYRAEHLRQPGQVKRFGETARHFADAAPYLIANVESLNALNDHLNTKGQSEVSLQNFRPNILLRGPAAFAEHTLKTLHYDQYEHEEQALQPYFNLIDACQRCIMITIDPNTGLHRPHASPFKELTEINPMPEQTKAPAFGVNATFETGLDNETSPQDHTISVGQRFICR